jgi:hypothetical protein
MGLRLRSGRIYRLLVILVSLSLLSALTTPSLAWACEGGAAEYEGQEAGNAIAAGNSTNASVGFQFGNAGEKKTLACEEKYTWAQQAKGNKFVVTPSYPVNANCTYNAAKAEVIPGGTCRYQFNQPIAVGAAWETTQSITPAGCEIKMKFEGSACEVKIKNKAANEGVSKVSLSNVGENLRIIPVVSPIKYTSAGCANPIAAAGAILTYSSQQEVAKAKIG